MLRAGAKLRATRCVVIKGSKRAEAQMRDLGIKLRYVPAQEFIDQYRRTPVDEEVRAMADDYMRRARRQVGATKADVINGVKSYVVARAILQREQGDAITMDCLGALGPTRISLPCIAWSKMNDDGVPAACEADLGAVATHTIVQYLFDRPGFQQDPVAETAREAIIGAHCSCPTRLGGFSQPPEPFDLLHHHGNRDAVPRTLWREGQRVTSADVLLGGEGQPTRMIISAGEVLGNVSVPPAGGCVVSVMVKFDGVTDVLAYPGFHQIFFYGDFKRELVQFCRLFGIQPAVV
jgi:L-fucose isomerase-like protein